MKKIILDLTPEILEKNYMNFDMCFLAAYSETNFKIFLKDSEPGGFLINLKKEEVGIKLPLKVVCNNHKEKNMAIILDYYEEVLDIIKGDDLTREMVLASDYPRLIKAILIYIVDYFERDQDLFAKEDINAQVRFITNYFTEHLSLLIYLSILYEYYQVGKMDISEDRKTAISNLLQMYLSRAVCKIVADMLVNDLQTYKEKAEQCEIEANKKERVISRKKKIIEKLRMEMKVLKTRTDEKLLESCERYKADLKKCREAYEKEVAWYEKMEKTMVPKEDYSKIEKEVIDIHAKYTDRGRQINELKRKLDEAHIGKEIEIFKEYLRNRGLSDELYQLMYPYYDAYISGVIPDAELKGDKLSFIGYTRLIDGQHHVFNAKGTGFRLFNLPDDIYLAENQFVTVSSKNTYIKSHDCFYSGDEEISTFAEVSSLNPVCAYTVRNGEERIWSDSFTDIRKGDIVGLDSGKVAVKKFDRTEILLDKLLPSIKAKGHTACYVIRNLSNGSLIYDCEEGIEKVLEVGNGGFERNRIVTLRENETIKVFEDERFVNKSISGNDSCMGFYIEDGCGRFISFDDGTRHHFSEFEFVESIDKKAIQNGDVLEINGFNVVVGVYDCCGESEQSDESKIMKRRGEERSAGRNDRMGYKNRIAMHPEKLLVVGNENFGGGYRLNFFKAGYDIRFIPGHSSYFDIRREALGSDLVVFVTTAASHENYYKIKDEFEDKLIYAESDGVNRIIRAVEEKLGRCESIQMDNCLA